MNDVTGSVPSHVPTPEFRAALERDVVRELYRELQFSSPRRWSHVPRLRLIAALVAGMILGVGTGFASAQVQDARQRDELAATMASTRQLALLRVELARTNYDLVRRGFDAGSMSPESLRAAEAELRAMELSLTRLDVDIQEVRATSASPRNELWAPSVSGRDFVKERLTLDAAGVQRKITAFESDLELADRRFRLGTATQADLRAAQSQVLDAKSEMEVVAQKLALRQQFLDEHVKPEEIAQRLQLFTVTSEIERMQRAQQFDAERLGVLRQRRDLGVVGDLEVKRAELQALEQEHDLLQLRLLLKDLERRAKR